MGGGPQGETENPWMNLFCFCDPQGEAKDLYDGKGQSKETLVRQKKVLEDKKKKMFATRKIFEVTL